MPKFAVPVWVRQRAMMMVEADNVHEAMRIVSDHKGTTCGHAAAHLGFIGEDINSSLTLDGVRKGKVTKLTDDDIDWCDSGEIDNDRGVPYEDYGPEWWEEKK